MELTKPTEAQEKPEKIKNFAKFDKLINPKELKDHPKNPNKHGNDQIERLSQIYKYQGIRHPIIVSSRSLHIVAGHGRKLAAIRAGLKKVPVVFQDFESDEQEYAFIVSDNAISDWAELDLSMINMEVPDMGPDFDINMLGIHNFKLDAFEHEEGLTDPDAIPEVKEPISKIGQIYQLGRHRLMCGDSTLRERVDALMGGEKAEVVFTDPPYGYEYESNHQNKHKALKNDDKILNFLPLLNEVTAENAAIFVCGSHQTIGEWKSLVEENFSYKNMIVWKKNNWSMGDLSGSFAGQHELILFAHKGRIEIRGERSRDIWEFDRDPPKDHPTQKPVELVEFAVQKTSDHGSNVLDLFGGSGSTLIACEKTGRTCFMMELDPHYVDVIITRWEQFTGKKAELIGGIDG